jgi:acyl dehydratase
MKKIILDRDFIGKQYPTITFDVELQTVLLFAKATGQDDPIYFDNEVAKESGFPAIPAPPTFLIVVAMKQDNPYLYLTDLNVPIGRILHAKEEYNYFNPIYVGDQLHMDSKIDNIFDKKNGALQFISFLSIYTNQNNTKVAESISTLVVR